MNSRQRYRKRPEQAVTAVQFDLDCSGFLYQKWGAEQRCKPGDWLVDNDGDIYSVDAEVFKRTYRKVQPGRFVKTTPVWAEQTEEAGSIRTKEGESHYQAGDFLVFNNQDGSDGYCVSADKFLSMYEEDEL